MTRHNIDWKKQEVEQIKNLATQYSSIAIANLDRFPASLFVGIRKKLSSDAVIKVSKTRVIKRAFEELGKEFPKLAEHTNNSVAIIFTNKDAFDLFATLKKNKGDTFAKPGMVAPKDIIVPEGDTGFTPGPALSSLKAAGLNAQPRGASIFLVGDKTVTKEGEVVTMDVASALSMLDIKPIKIGLKLNAVLDNGQVFLADVLNIDTDEVFSNFVSAQQSAFNLAFNSGYPTSETIPLLVQKAFTESKALALEANILTKYTVESLLAKADAQVKALKNSMPDVSVEVSEEKVKTEEKSEEKSEVQKDETPEEPKVEETKNEKPAEQADDKKEN